MFLNWIIMNGWLPVLFFLSRHSLPFGVLPPPIIISITQYYIIFYTLQPYRVVSLSLFSVVCGFIVRSLPWYFYSIIFYPLSITVNHYYSSSYSYSIWYCIDCLWEIMDRWHTAILIYCHDLCFVVLSYIIDIIYYIYVFLYVISLLWFSFIFYCNSFCFEYTINTQVIHKYLLSV